MTDTEDQTPDNTPRKMRTIRSFVKRSGRMSEIQRDAYPQNFERVGLLHTQGMLNFEDVFNRQAPVVLEIGFGMGASLAEMATTFPEQDYIGIEVHHPGVGKLMELSTERNLKNIRVFNHDAIEILKDCIPDKSLEGVQLFFPDPWHKKRHKKRRIVQADFAHMLRGKIRNGGFFHMATDWQDYAEHMLEVMEAAEGFENEAGQGNYSPQPDWRPVTKFQKRGERLGHGVWDLIYRVTA